MILTLYLFVGFDADYKTLIYASILSNLIVLVYLIYKQHKFLPNYSFSRLMGSRFAKFKDDTNKKFIKLTILASSNYFIYGLLLSAPVFSMLNYESTDELAQFQVVARSIYFALVAVFSWPLGRFMFPEFSALIADKNYKALKLLRVKFIKLLVVFGVISIVSSLFLSKLLIGYLFPLEYIQSYKMLNILIVILPFVMYQNFSESIIKAVGDYKTNFIIKFSGIVVYIIAYTILKFVLGIALASIYSFVAGLFAIFLFSLYFELKIKKSWSLV
jgi:O-antigen/teichoic acid export membrane protein